MSIKTIITGIVAAAGVSGAAQADDEFRYDACAFMGNAAALVMEYRQEPGARLYELVLQSEEMENPQTRSMVLGLAEIAFRLPYHVDAGSKINAVAEFSNTVANICLEGMK